MLRFFRHRFHQSQRALALDALGSPHTGLGHIQQFSGARVLLVRIVA